MRRFSRENDQTQIGKPADQEQKIPDRMQASIVIVEGQVRGMEYALAKSYTVIGRDKAADISPDDSRISRRHAVVVYLDGSYILKDLDSTNGTVMNGAFIKQANLRHGDKFRVGETTFQFILQENSRNTTYEIE
jgi:pSer/pThr/pTyr-binding forkhead associated (FHA) protein